jgi:hypothetical protein
MKDPEVRSTFDDTSGKEGFPRKQQGFGVWGLGTTNRY